MDSGSDLQENVEKQAFEAAQRLQYLPELQRTKDGNYVQSDCVDLYKLESFEKLKNASSYRKYFPDTLVVLELVYPENKQDRWTLYNYTSNTSSSGERHYLPISLYNATAEEYYFGYIMVEARY